jgi:hypothetical protein
MDDHLCDECEFAITDNEYFMVVDGKPITIDAILCDNTNVKNRYYNRKNRTKKARLDATGEMPLLIGTANEHCRGIDFKRSVSSVLDRGEEDDR